jgi:hypothetical protein
MIAAQTPPERTDTTGDRDLTVRVTKATAAALAAPAAPPRPPDCDGACAPGRDVRAQGGRGRRRGLLHARSHVVLRLGARLDHQAAHGARTRAEARKGARYLPRDRPSSRGVHAASLPDGVRGRRGPLGRLLRHRPELLAAGRRVRRPRRDRARGRPAPSARSSSSPSACRSRCTLPPSRCSGSWSCARSRATSDGRAAAPRHAPVGRVGGVLFGGLAVILAVPFTSAVATLIDVLVLGHEPPTEQPRRSLRLRRSE